MSIKIGQVRLSKLFCMGLCVVAIKGCSECDDGLSVGARMPVCYGDSCLGYVQNSQVWVFYASV